MIFTCLQRLYIGALIFPRTVFAIILLNGDNTANREAPGTGIPFENVALISNGSFSTPAGSAVLLKGKYLLTARHVANSNTLTFDGIHYWERDLQFSPRNIGTADLKVIKLKEDPGLEEIHLATTWNTDIPSDDTEVVATLVGFGRGRRESDTDASNGWAWGGNDTIAKRWGTNVIEGTEEITSYGSLIVDYTALYTLLNDDDGENEAALVYYDSGSPAFIQEDGIWYLAGIGTDVSTLNNSRFDSDLSEKNFCVRLSEWHEQILAAIPDTTTFSGWLIDNCLYNADANEDSDVDFDGLTNLEEFAYGGHPNIPETHILPRIVQDQSGLYLEFKINSSAKGIIYTPEWTGDIASPDWRQSDIVLSLHETLGEIEIWRAYCSQAKESVFLRLRLTLD